jgi:hypothetical protein
MPRRDALSRSRAARARIDAVKEQILAIDDVVRGTLLRRTKACGKAWCRCATDPAARHGPYFEWGRLAAGKRSSSVVGAETAARIARALANRSRLERLLRRWEALTLRAIEAETDANADSPRS